MEPRAVTILRDIEKSGQAYVYEHWRTDHDRPFWVGKGSGFRYRVFKRNRHYNAVVAKLKAAGLSVEIKIVRSGLSHEEAFALEIERIEHWLASGVALTNKAAGGTGGNFGYKRSEESRRKQSASLKKRGGFSADHRAALKAAAGRPETRELLSARLSGRKLSEGHKRKISVALMGHGPTKPKGAHWSEAMKSAQRDRMLNSETRETIRASSKRQWNDPEMREKMIAGMRRAAADRAAKGEATR